MKSIAKRKTHEGRMDLLFFPKIHKIEEKKLPITSLHLSQIIPNLIRVAGESKHYNIIWAIFNI